MRDIMARQKTLPKKKVEVSGIEAPLGRRERSKREKWERISKAARTLFQEQGFSQTTTQQIAEMAGIGTGTLFLYAESKEDLLAMVFKDEMQAKAESIFENLSSAGNVIDEIMSIFVQMVDYHNKDIELSRILHKDMAQPPSKMRAKGLAELMRTIIGGLEAFITHSKSAGKVSQTLDPYLAACTVFSIYYFGLMGWLSGFDTRTRFLAHTRAQVLQLLDIPSE